MRPGFCEDVSKSAFYLSTLSCVLGPARRRDTSDPTLQFPYQPIIFFHYLLRYVADTKFPDVPNIQKPYFVRCWDTLRLFF